MVSLPSPALVLAAWAISGLLALCGAAVYAELGTMLPRVGGEYVYVSRAFGPAAGFVSGWVALIVGFAAQDADGLVIGLLTLAVLAAVVIADQIVAARRSEPVVAG